MSVEEEEEEARAGEREEREALRVAVVRLMMEGMEGFAISVVAAVAVGGGETLPVVGGIVVFSFYSSCTSVGIISRVLLAWDSVGHRVICGQESRPLTVLYKSGWNCSLHLCVYTH